MATTTVESSSKAHPGAGFAKAMSAMTPQERLAIYRSGGFTRAECTIWTANHPEEVPLVNGEYEWIALRLADLD